MLVPALIFAVAGIVIILVAIPLTLGRVAPNALYGLRIRATFADERVWYEANARSGRDLMFLGLLVALASVALPFAPGITPERFGLVMSLGLVVGVVGAGVVGWRRANRLLKRYHEQQSRSE